MKKKIVSLVLAVLLIGLFLPGCVSKTELDECKALTAEQAAQIEKLRAQAEDWAAQIEAKNTEILELKEENAGLREENTELLKENTELQEANAELEAEVECLKKPTPKISAEAVGTVNLKQLMSLAKEFFPKANGSVGSWTKGPFPLVSLETLKEFLAEDPINMGPGYHRRESQYYFYDDLAFELKDHWIRAGLPGHSISLIKAERISPRFGKQMCWRNIFITKEQGQLVIYEVIAQSDTVIKIEEPNLETYQFLIADRL